MSRKEQRFSNSIIVKAKLFCSHCQLKVNIPCVKLSIPYDLLEDLNAISIHLGLFYGYSLRNNVHSIQSF